MNGPLIRATGRAPREQMRSLASGQLPQMPLSSWGEPRQSDGFSALTSTARGLSSTFTRARHSSETGQRNLSLARDDCFHFGFCVARKAHNHAIRARLRHTVTKAHPESPAQSFLP